MRWKYLATPSYVLHYETLETETLEIEPQATYEEKPSQIIDRKDNDLRNRTIQMLKAMCGNHTEEDATWELKTAIRETYLHLYTFRRLNFCKGVRI